MSTSALIGLPNIYIEIYRYLYIDSTHIYVENAPTQGHYFKTGEGVVSSNSYKQTQKVKHNLEVEKYIPNERKRKGNLMKQR